MVEFTDEGETHYADSTPTCMKITSVYKVVGGKAVKTGMLYPTCLKFGVGLDLKDSDATTTDRVRELIRRADTSR